MSPASLLLVKKDRKTVHLGLCGHRPRPTLSAPMGACSRAPLGVDYHPHKQGGWARSFLLVTVAPSDRRLAELPPLTLFVSLTPAWLGRPAGCFFPSIPDRLGASWPALRRGPRGCQAGRAPARLPSTKRLCRACRGLAGGQAASGKSRER